MEIEDLIRYLDSRGLEKTEDKGREPAAQSEESLRRMADREKYVPRVYDDARRMGRNGFYLSEEDIKNKNYKGNPTVGYGHKLSKDELDSGMVDGKSIYGGFKESGQEDFTLDPTYTGGLTKEEAFEQMREHPVRKDVQKAIDLVKVLMNQGQEDALHEAGFNIGPGALKKIIDTANKKSWDAAADRLQKYDKATVKDKKGKKKKVKMKGLTERRKDEADRLRNEGIEDNGLY